MDSTEVLGESPDYIDEIRRDRIVIHISHLTGEELQRVCGLCISLRVDNGSIRV